jgi:hypothetical protein
MARPFRRHQGPSGMDGQINLVICVQELKAQAAD